MRWTCETKYTVERASTSCPSIRKLMRRNFTMAVRLSLAFAWYCTFIPSCYFRPTLSATELQAKRPSFKRTIRRALFSAVSSNLWKTEIANPPLPNQHAVAILLAIYAGRVAQSLRPRRVAAICCSSALSRTRIVSTHCSRRNLHAWRLALNEAVANGEVVASSGVPRYRPTSGRVLAAVAGQCLS